jgi:hypothetical protein
VLIGLRVVTQRHPFFHYSVREILLLTLPVGLLMAGAWGGERIGPVAKVQDTIVVFVDPEPATSTTTASHALSSGDAGETLAATQPSPTRPGLYFWVGLLTAAAAGLTLMRLGQLAREVWALRRFRQALSPVSEKTKNQVIAPLEARCGGSPGAVAYGVAPAGTMPATFGWVRPVVALPEDLFEREEALRMAIMHELVHVRRRDYLFRWVERVMDALFAVSPFTRYLVKEIGQYRELACDWEVAKETAAPGAYAALLAGHLVRASRLTPAALGMARSSFIKVRIEALYRFARGDRSMAVPYGASFCVSALILAAVSAVVFLTACSEQPSTAPGAQSAQEGAQQELFFRDLGLVTILSEPVSVFSEPVRVDLGGSVRLQATGWPLGGAQVFYATGGQTDTTTTNALGRFAFQGLPSDAERVQVTARHEGREGTYEITREKTLERLPREKRRVSDEQRQMVMDSDFRLVPAEVVINGRRMQAPDEPMRSVNRMLETPTAYMTLRIPDRGRLVVSGAAFDGAKKAVRAQGHTITFITDEVDIAVTTRVPVLKDGGAVHLWGRYDAEGPVGIDGMRVGGGTDVSSFAKRDSMVYEANRECGEDGRVSEDCFFRGT